MSTRIEWTDEVWNPVVGCDKVSPGCDNCYAIGVAHRAMQPAHVGLSVRRDGERPDWSGVVRELADRLDVPFGWKRPRRVFVNSMSDLFHPAVSRSFIATVWAAMALTPRHTYQVLTKRPQRMARVVGAHDWEASIEDAFGCAGIHDHVDWQRCEYPAGETGWLPNVWLGTSIESDRYTRRAHTLRHTPAAVRFLSLEPLLGPVPSLELDGIDWVIVGGESGPGARPMHPDWVREIRDRCVAAGVPFFFKQWGEWRALADDELATYGRTNRMDTPVGRTAPAACVGNGGVARMRRVGKKNAGRELDGRTWDQYPEVARP